MSKMSQVSFSSEHGRN